MIEYNVLILTLGILLGVVLLTTGAAIVNKILSLREASTRQATMDRLRQAFLLLTDPREAHVAHRVIADAVSGPWAELASEEVAQLDLTLRLDVVRMLEDQGVVARYLRDAKRGTKWIRARALRILGDLKVPASVPALLHALEDRDADVRNVAARSLGRMKLQAAEEALISLLGKHDQAVSSRIAAICIEMGPRTAPLLIRTLREGSPKARFWAARVLGEIRDTRAIRSLGDALLDADPEVRSAATWALGRIGERATASLIEPILRDGAWYARAHAAEALGRLGDPTYAAALGESLRDRSWWVRKNALDALVLLGEPATPVLLKSLQSDDRFARDCAVEALMTLGVPLPAGADGAGGSAGLAGSGARP
ncbi:MAG TPA: HEAT repeat domain-containing protein [Candidatus Eisenbacteria bacterium]|nr:HEAT repeat domain-containing protein [Candidatus Eisenbacteria bacterium]